MVGGTVLGSSALGRDEMNPRDRFLTTLGGGVADRVPLFLQGFCHGSPEEVREPAEREIVERIISETHFQMTTPSHVNRYFVTPPQRIKVLTREEREGEVTVTSEIDTPKGPLIAVTGENATSRTTWHIKYPVETLEDVEKIRSVPWELPRDLAPPDTAALAPEAAARGVVITHVSSPFVCVAGMMPYQYFLELCATEFDLLKELTAQCQERILEVLEVLFSGEGIELVWMGGCEWLTPPMASPRHYKELVQEFERRIIERIHAAGALSHVHCHGNVRSTLEMVIDRGADYFEPVEPPPDGDITFAEAKELADGRVTLGGNIEARVLENESADAVERAVREAFEGDKRRMVLQNTAGPISALTPRAVENYRRLIDVWEELSPISPPRP